jgi:hypothetical protein
MGSRGPVPKRSDKRLGHPTKAKADEAPLTKAPSGSALVWPAPDEAWHPIARDWYLALQESGQSRFYEQSDVATARYVAEGMSRNLENSRFSAQLFAAVSSAMSSLLVTEGDRRRVRLELERESAKAEAAEQLPSIDEYRKRLTGG